MNRLALVCGVLVVGTGCGSDDVGEAYEELLEEFNEALALVCECDSDPASCRAVFELDVSIAQDPCVLDALEIDEDATLDAVECATDVFEDYTDCIEDNLVCDDLNSLDLCDEVIDRADTECPQVPDEVEDALEDCDVELLGSAISPAISFWVGSARGTSLSSDPAEMSD